MSNAQRNPQPEQSTPSDPLITDAERWKDICQQFEEIERTVPWYSYARFPAMFLAASAKRMRQVYSRNTEGGAIHWPADVDYRGSKWGFRVWFCGIYPSASLHQQMMMATGNHIGKCLQVMSYAAQALRALPDQLVGPKVCPDNIRATPSEWMAQLFRFGWSEDGGVGFHAERSFLRNKAALNRGMERIWSKLANWGEVIDAAGGPLSPRWASEVELTEAGWVYGLIEDVPGVSAKLAGTIQRRLERQAGAGQAIEEKPLSEPEPNLIGVRSAETKPLRPEFSNSVDYSSVVWHGEEYVFTKRQAGVVQVLWEAKGHVLKQETIAEKSGANPDTFRMAHTFRNRVDGKYQKHPALGTMIQSPSKGAFRIPWNDDPESSTEVPR